MGHSDDLNLQRITKDTEGNIICPNEGSHPAHTNAIWNDWGNAEVWTCDGGA